MKTSRVPTDFEMAVYAVVRRIPVGKVATYGTVVRELARGTARAVGSALAKNPYAPEVPCHRVVRADGTMGGFHGETMGPRLAEKCEILMREGVQFRAPGRVAGESMVDTLP